ncbi:MAG TPA: ARMT1-like domain-containing protein [Melioribacteraceae bacterium]|nr:ARMT1-like domain-containing protein [Melioribacteraceae bacterium]
MLNSPGCISCIVKQAYSLSKLVGIKEEETQKEIIFSTMEMLLKNKNLESAPHFSIMMLNLMKRYVNIDEHFELLKYKNGKLAEGYLSYLKIIMDEAEDKLEMAIRISIMGNTIDLAANPNFDLESDVNKLTSESYNLSALRLFKEQLNSAKTILFIADNYEEAIFDRFLLEQLNDKELVFATRGNKVYNDITYEDAINLGYNKICKVINSGSIIAGTALEQCTTEFINYYNNSDIVISKGQGNYETLLKEERPIYFMFKVKCETIAEISKQKIYTNVMLFNKQPN